MDFEKLKTWWRKRSSFLRLKIHEELPGEPKIHDMGRLLLKEIHAETQTTPPQVLQGMWQAYGQMRAARTTARATIIATGILGAGLFAYQRKIKKKEKEIDHEKLEVRNLQEELKRKANKLNERTEELEIVAQDILDEAKEVDAHRTVWNKACQGKNGEENLLSREQCNAIKDIFHQAIKGVSPKK